jgi:SagB-type dehydrogenase family enzyme
MRDRAMPDHAAVLQYHERSKHRLDAYAPGPRGLDWANQPDPFRVYAGAPRVVLPLLADALATRFADVRAGCLPAPTPISLDSIAMLLELSLAISAWKSYRGSSWALRCNPSSGNLHPTEGYVVAGDVPGLRAGIYHYASREHALELRAPLGGDAPNAAGFLVGLASIYWREAWKYGMRAFRYCQHDCGHAIAAVSYAAAALGWPVQLLDAPGDDRVAALLGLNRIDDFAGAEREQPDCLLWVGPAVHTDARPPDIDALAAAAAAAPWRGRANPLSRAYVEWRDIDIVHSATHKPGTAPVPLAQRQASVAPSAPRLDLAAAALYRQRRSAVDFDGVTSISAQAFHAMLEPLLPHAGAPPWRGWPWRPSVHLALLVHRVADVEPGLYLLLRDPSDLGALRTALRADALWRKTGSAHLPLYLLLPYDLRQAARLICCHQDIAADGCFALGMLASLDGVERAPWIYRRRYWECGMIGQTLYLEAEAAGIRGTGIGCYFDDEMHELLGLSDRSWQSLYHFTAGGAVEDTRLTTLPPYSPRAPSAAP